MMPWVTGVGFGNPDFRHPGSHSLSSWHRFGARIMDQDHASLRPPLHPLNPNPLRTHC